MYTYNALSASISMRGRGTKYTSKENPDLANLSSLYVGGTDTDFDVNKTLNGFDYLSDRLVKHVSFISASLRGTSSEDYTSRGYPVFPKQLVGKLFSEMEKQDFDWLVLPKTTKELICAIRTCVKGQNEKPMLYNAKESYRIANAKKDEGLMLADYDSNEGCYYLYTPEVTGGSMATCFVPVDKIAMFHLNQSKVLSPRVRKRVAVATLDLFSRLNPRWDKGSHNKTIAPIKVNVSLPYKQRRLSNGHDVCDEYLEGFKMMSQLLEKDCTMTIECPIKTSLRITLSVGE